MEDLYETLKREGPIGAGQELLDEEPSTLAQHLIDVARGEESDQAKTDFIAVEGEERIWKAELALTICNGTDSAPGPLSLVQAQRLVNIDRQVLSMGASLGVEIPLWMPTVVTDSLYAELRQLGGCPVPAEASTPPVRAFGGATAPIVPMAPARPRLGRGAMFGLGLGGVLVGAMVLVPTFRAKVLNMLGMKSKKKSKRRRRK